MKNFTPYRLVLFEGVADAFMNSLMENKEWRGILSQRVAPRIAPTSIKDKSTCEDDIRKRLGEINETISNALLDGESTTNLHNEDLYSHTKRGSGFISSVLAQASHYSLLRPYVEQIKGIFALDFRRLRVLLPGFNLPHFTENYGIDTLVATLGGYFNLFNAYNPQSYPRQTISYLLDNCTIKLQKQLLEGILDRIRKDVDTHFRLYYKRGVKCTGLDLHSMELHFTAVLTGAYAVTDRSGKVLNGRYDKSRDYLVDYSYRYHDGKWLLSAIKMSILSVSAKPTYFY